MTITLSRDLGKGLGIHALPASQSPRVCRRQRTRYPSETVDAVVLDPDVALGKLQPISVAEVDIEPRDLLKIV